MRGRCASPRSLSGVLGVLMLCQDAAVCTAGSALHLLMLNDMKHLCDPSVAFASGPCCEGSACLGNRSEEEGVSEGQLVKGGSRLTCSLNW